VADNPQQTVRELKDLVIAYAKQEATDPFKNMTRTIGFGLGGAILLGTGVTFLAMGLLRVLQENGGHYVHGNWSWVPYAVVIVALVIVAALVWYVRSRASRKVERSIGS
jgi:Putative Actinobacterial Holin-X, holin superfamily III